ncbi:hypothetical protein HPULCUR_007429 [Helicostylum pulchrum]|uniref:Uncharacterized protein n=1 Tax=Helicostylum pulchrum TaxID=562976 RepID=A0ABP9Y4Q9_9FUNG
MVFLPNFNETINLYNTTGFDPSSSDSRYTRSSNYEGGGDNGNRNNGFLVAVERRLRMEREVMIEAAVERQVQQMQCHSNTTVATLIQCPPPSYSPPDPTTQLSSATVNRLDQLLLENQIPLSLSNRALPKYSE